MSEGVEASRSKTKVTTKRTPVISKLKAANRTVKLIFLLLLKITNRWGMSGERRQPLRDKKQTQNLGKYTKC